MVVLDFKCRSHTWTVHVLDPTTDRSKYATELGGKHHGMTIYKDKVILLDANQTPHQMLDTFVHELCHVVLEDIHMDTAEEESLVRHVLRKNHPSPQRAL